MDGPFADVDFLLDEMQEVLLRPAAIRAPGFDCETRPSSYVQDDEIADAKDLDDASIRVLSSFRLLPDELRLLLAAQPRRLISSPNSPIISGSHIV